MHTTRQTRPSIAAFCALALFSVSSAAAKDPVKVYLLGGQSNMVGVGQAAELVAPYKKAQDDVRFWSGGKWAPLAMYGRTFGPELSFGHAIKKARPDQDIYLVKYAAGGTALYNDWSPAGNGGPQYNQFMKTAKAALANLDKAGTKYEIAGMLWMQGESDAHEKRAADYEKNLRAFIAHMRESFETPEMPFIIGRVKDFYGGKSGQAKIVRDAQEKVAKTTDHVEWFDTDKYSLKDPGHYNGAGLFELGKDFAKAILAIK